MAAPEPNKRFRRGQASEKGTLARYPEITPREFGTMLIAERARGVMWKVLVYRTGYSKARLIQLYDIARSSIDIPKVDPAEPS